MGVCVLDHQNISPSRPSGLNDAVGTGTLAAEGMTIGQLANLVAVGVETIRYYERLGLLTRPVKPSIGYRRYTASALARLTFIRQTQALGLSLRDIASLVVHLHDHRTFCAVFKGIAEHQLRALSVEREILRRREVGLQQVLLECNGVTAASPESPNRRAARFTTLDPIPAYRV